MRKLGIALSSVGLLHLTACANTPANQADLTAAYNVAAAVEAAYVANPKANADTVKQLTALLASAQAALLAWQNAPSGSTAEETVLSAAIAALVAFEAQINQPITVAHVTNACDPADPTCIDGVHRG
jgi:hypothetical protein